MKRQILDIILKTVLALQCIIFTTNILHAQETKSLWTEADRQYTLENMRRTRDALIKETENLTPAQWAFRDSAHRWSIGEVVEHHPALRQMAFSQLLLDPQLPFPQPGQRRIKIILVGTVQLQVFHQRGVMPELGGGQFRGGAQQPFHDHRHHQIPLAARFGRDHCVQPKFAHRAQNRRYVTAGQ